MFAIFFAVPRLLFRGILSFVVFLLSWCAHGVRSAWADITVYWTAATGQLYIECDDDADHLVLLPEEGGDRVSLYSTTDANADGLLEMDCTDVEEISIRAGDGNDTIDVGPVVPVGGFDNITRIDIQGEDGGDDLYGSSHYADSIVGGQGPDSCAGHAGDDSIFGQGDSDQIIGGTGDDVIDGGVGTDSILGEEDDDQIVGGDGHDTIDGGAGADSILGQGDNDQIIGGYGNDTIDGGLGADSVLGEEDDDQVVGGSGGDTIDGGLGADSIVGQQGADSIAGGDGDDTLYHGTVANAGNTDGAEDSLWGSDFGDTSSELGDVIYRNIADDGDWLDGEEP